MDEVEQILGGSDYFYCKRAKCTLKYEVCIKRQQQLMENPNFEQYIMCAKCPQGIENIRLFELHAADSTVLQPCETSNKPSPDPEKEIPRCEMCGKNPKPLFQRYCNSCIRKLVSQPGYLESRVRKIETRKREREQMRKDSMIRYIFSRCPEALDEVTNLSALEGRPLDEQVIFMVKAQISENNLQSCVGA